MSDFRSGAEHSLLLNGTWSLTYGPQSPTAPATPADLAAASWPTIPATVPGNVQLDLLAAGLIQEPSYASHIYDLLPFEYYRWFYRRSFTPRAIAPGHRAILRFHGLDCIATIFLNGQNVGNAANMLISHDVDITGHLRPGVENELVVRLDSAVLAGREHRPALGEWTRGCKWESLAIRKAPHMYGWDIMPRLVTAGLWRDVELLILPPTRIDYVYWATLAADAAARTATVTVSWDFVTDQPDIFGWRVRVSLARDGRTVHTCDYPVFCTHGRADLRLDDVDLWFPRGYGPQPLYDATVELLDPAGAVLDAHATRIGVRTARLRRTDITTPERPGEFLFLVNDTPIFVRGTNWVPLDAFHSRDAGHLAAVFAMVTDLNCNMIRCWGGNVYEDHAFFDLCDQHGIMVWQDFALACCLYPQTDAFADAIRREAEAIIAKLRNHPSLVLWAGNNEIDEAHSWAGFGIDPNTDRLSRQVLPNAVRQFDPLRDYLPSSPYRSPALIAAGNHAHLKPEDHLWGPRNDFKGPYYTSSPTHFASEIGYHGCPARESLARMVDPEHLWPWQDNDQWFTLSVRPIPSFSGHNGRISLMARQIAVLFGDVPADMDDYILASQISQAEALKFFIEHFRQAKFRRTGIIWWNLRDGWPIISDAIVDYYGCKKLAYLFVKRSQTDVCPICAEPTEGRHRLIVVNDTLSPVTGVLQVTDLDTGAPLFEGPCNVPANGKAEAGSILAPAGRTMLLLRWSSPDHSTVNHYLAGPRPFSLAACARWLQAAGLLTSHRPGGKP